MMRPCERAVTSNSGGESFVLDDERVVATDHERITDALEDADVLVVHEAGTTVQQFRRAVDRRAEGLAERLVAETDPEHRDALLGAVADDLDAVPRVTRVSRSGRHQDAVGLHRRDVGRRHFVVATHRHLGAQFGHVLDEVVDERVVVVDDEDVQRGAH